MLAACIHGKRLLIRNLAQEEQAMTNLGKIDLPTSRKVDLAVLSLATQGDYGSISALSERFEVSRPTIYDVKRSTSNLLEKHFDGADETMGTQHVVVVDEAQLRRAIVALRMEAPNTLRPIENLIPILYPGLSVSYGKIQGILVEAEERARAFNEKADLSAIIAAAVDEMYSQGAPVLAGVDLVSGYLFSLALRSSRGGEDWAEVLRPCKEQGMELKKVVKDAALGIAAGVSEVYPNAEQRDDCFHAQYEMGKVYFGLERKAYGAIAKVEEVKAAIEKCRRTGRGDRAKLRGQMSAATQRCNAVLERHDLFEKAMRRAQEAMEVVDPCDGKLRSAAWIQTELEYAAQQMMELNDYKCRKVGLYLSNRAPGLASHARELADHMEVLSSLWGQEAVESACLIHRLLSDLGHRHLSFRKWEAQKQLEQAYSRLQKHGGKYADAVLADVDLVMGFRHRASSAIEGFNAALRPHLYVQKGVSQGFLELFRAHHNLKTRRWGRHKGTSAHELVTGEEVEDWLTPLGFPPSSALN
jgi:hypothetical protein